LKGSRGRREMEAEKEMTEEEEKERRSGKNNESKKAIGIVF